MSVKGICISITLSVLLLTGNGKLHAQLQVWRHINVAEMGNTNVVCITEGPTGFLYFGTQEGVEMFDGRRFHKIKIPDQINKGINPFTDAMKWDGDGLLWVATRSHIFNYDPASDSVHVSYNTPHATLLSIETDTLRHRLYAIDDYGFSAFTITDTALTPLYTFPLTGLSRMVQAEQGVLFAVKDGNEIWEIKDTIRRIFFRAAAIKDIAYMPMHKSLIALTAEGLQQLALKDGNKKILSATKSWNLGSAKTRITALAGDALLIQNAEHASLLRSLDDTSFVDFSPDIRNPGSIKANFLTFAYSDRRKNLWVAEDGAGISVLPAHAGNIQYLPGTMVGAARLWKLYHDRNRKQILASSENGLCAIRYNTDTVNYKPDIRPAGTRQFEVMDYVPWGKDTLLLITNGQGSWLFNTYSHAFKPFDPLNRVLGGKGFWGGRLLSDSTLLLFGANGSYLFNKRSLALRAISYLKKDSSPLADVEARKNEIYCASLIKKEIWLGTGFGILVLDSNGAFLRKIGDNRSDKNNGLGNTVVLDIKQAPNGKIYIATMGGGIYEYMPEGRFRYLPLTGNLANIYCIEPIDQRSLLITTTKGLCLYNTDDGQSQLINDNNGMPIADFNQFALVCDSQMVLGAGAKGIIMIGKEELYHNFHDTAELKVMSGPLAISTLTLAKGNHSIDLEITVTGYSAATPWAIEYKLDGLDDKWRTMTKGEWHIRYNSIMPGEYTLQVRAVDEQHVVYLRPVSLPVIALPFFWQTKWFQAILFCICLVLLIFTVRFFSQQGLKWQLKKLEDEKKISKERLRISRELHDNVGSQLTYLITGLESSGMLLQKKETVILEQKIERLHHSARESMQQLRDAIWALNSESVATSVLLQRFKEWLDKIMEAFPAITVSLTHHIANDVLLDPVKSLNLFRIMQEAVHNVIKHADASELMISFVSDNGRLNITIRDNGKGFNTAAQMGNGRKSMSERVKEMKAELNTSSMPGGGTEITLSVSTK